MPQLSTFFAIYTDGAAPRGDLVAPRGVEVSLVPMDPFVVPGSDANLFGPHAADMLRQRPRAGYLLSVRRDTRASAGNFFTQAHQLLCEAVGSLDGWGFDVLRMYPFPLTSLAEQPDEPFAEDLISVGFHEQGEHGFRAETFGLAKLGQREVTFTFKGSELLEDAAILCSHLADYVMGQARRVEHKQTMSFGFDKLLFLAAEGEQHTGTVRSWHPQLFERLLPTRLFEGVGVLRVMGYGHPGEQPQNDLTPALARALEQRLVLEEHDLTGESPHQATTVRSCACAGGPDGLRGDRREPQSVKESGWVFTCLKAHPSVELKSGTLEELAKGLPQILRYLALPPGCALKWTPHGVVVDSHGARRDETDSGIDR